jgi:hypothetical protein
MTAQGERRKSGRTTAEEVTRDAAKEADQPVNPQEPGERDVQFTTPGLGRMRLGWADEDAQTLRRVQARVDKVLDERFWSLYAVLFEMRSIVRDPVIDPETNQQAVNDKGQLQWGVDPATGLYVEDWNRLTDGAKRELLYKIINLMFEWEMSAEELRTDSLFAKAKWEEMFAEGFESLPAITATRPTVDDREARAKRSAAQDRYFAVFATSLSRQADVLVRSMDRLQQRLKDLLPQR